MLHSHSRSFLKLPSKGKGVFNTGAHLVECVGSKMKKIKKIKKSSLKKKGGGVNFHAFKQMQNKGLERTDAEGFKIPVSVSVGVFCSTYTE